MFRPPGAVPESLVAKDLVTRAGGDWVPWSRSVCSDCVFLATLTTQQGISDSGVPDVLLLKPQRRREDIIEEVTDERPFFRSELGECPASRTGLGSPMSTVGQQRFSVHEYRMCVGKDFPDSTKDREAMGVDVAPVDEISSVKPASAASTATANPLPKIDNRVRTAGKARIGDLVLDDVAWLDAALMVSRGQLAGRGQSARRTRAERR